MDAIMTFGTVSILWSLQRLTKAKLAGKDDDHDMF